MSQYLPALYQLGIVGSGQIARMVHQSAVKLGITPRVMAERLDDSAALAAPDTVINHPDALSGMAADCEVLTFEHERVDLGLLRALEERGHRLRPGTKTLHAASDKLHLRRMLAGRGYLVPPCLEVRGPDDLMAFTAEHGYPAMIKTVHAAPPGQQGVWRVEDEGEALKVVAEHQCLDLFIEPVQAIIKELVVLIARRPAGQASCYPLIETTNRSGAVDEIRCPADIGSRLAAEARDLALDVAEVFDAVGLLAVELFLTTDGLVINELAARPHNAGHFTIEACPTSQFENHVRAVLDLPLGPTWLRAPVAVTVNVVGTIDGTNPAMQLPEALAVEGVSIHLYGKAPRPGRKLGHVTAMADDLASAQALARRAEAALLGR